jgi:anaphase-promoting complex subunit 1
VEDGGKLKVLTDIEEKIIWSSCSAPYIVTYHTGRRQHSVWQVKAAPPDLEMNSHSEPTLMQGHAWENSGTVCLQRVWVKKGGQQQTTQVSTHLSNSFSTRALELHFFPLSVA